MDPSPSSVDPQQSSEVFAQEHPGDQSMRAHSPQTVPIRAQSLIGAASAAGTSAPSQRQSQVAQASSTATHSRDSPRGIISGSDSGHDHSGAPDESDHAPPDAGGTENEDGSFKIKASELSTLQKEYVDLMNLKENSEIVLVEAMEATKRLNTVFNQIRRSMNRMSPTMKDIFLVPNSKAARHSHRALELQLKVAEEKVNTLLYEEAPEEVLLEVAWEARNIHFQLDQNTRLREAGLMPEQQVRFRTYPGGSVNCPSREYGVNPIHEVHIAQQEADTPMPQQTTPALLMTAQLDGAVVNRTSEYGGIQQMMRQAIQNASHEAEPEKSFLAKAGVKMGNPPTYSGEHNLEKFENWVVQLQFLGQCLTDEAQEWFYRKKWFMPTLLMNKVAVNYDTMQGSMTMQQLHQELTKLAKQMIELPDAYSHRGRFMNAQKPDIRDQVLRKCFTPEFSTATAESSHTQHTTTQNKSSMNQNAGSSKQHKSGNKPIQNHLTTQLLSTGGGGNVRINPTYGKNPIKLGNTVKKPTQDNPIRTAPKANNTVVCYNCNQPGHIRPNCPSPDKDRRVAGARIEEVILEEDEDQIEEFDEDVPQNEEQQDWEDQPE
ncbi:hypothetical protein M422DRAFT_266853 [Sphaerobolus stellatus SS14]|uniref:CCHC-type domain-containing protein n=1 Tax=Sphaerobolus stellatus (strain SS14) TaxID=990650 RepID=A0A0C9V1N4_SPHS4|nr:hypothetical protein M422DRAFT_266853 [Sphaerobolus stellatus SS14]